VSKRTGLGDRLYWGTADLSGDVGSVQTLATPRAVLGVTGIDKDAYERILGLADGQVVFASFWNDAGNVPQLRSMPDADVITSYYAGTAIGNAAASITAKKSDQGVNRGEDGSLVLSTSAQANGYPLEWGVQLTNGKQTFASSGTAAPVDYGAASNFGGVAYLHVFSIASGTATVKVQHSSDNSTYADLITFTAAPAATSERKATAAITTTVNRYTSVTITGTFTNLVCAVQFVRYPTSQT